MAIFLIKLFSCCHRKDRPEIHRLASMTACVGVVSMSVSVSMSASVFVYVFAPMSLSVCNKGCIAFSKV